MADIPTMTTTIHIYCITALRGDVFFVCFRFNKVKGEGPHYKRENNRAYHMG